MYCKNCRKKIPDGKFCVFCGKELKNKNKLKGINLFQTLMTLLLTIWLIIYIVLSVIIIYNIDGNDYSMLAAFLVGMLDFAVVPCLIVVNLCIIMGKNKSNRIDFKKIIAIVLIIIMIFFSVYALLYDDNSLGMAIKLYIIPILVYSFISLINAIIKMIKEKI